MMGKKLRTGENESRGGSEEAKEGSSFVATEGSHLRSVAVASSLIDRW